MTTLYEKAYAKINLTLDVLGKREDGFHELQTVMQSLSLCDDIEIDVETGKPWTLSCEKPGVPCDERNLAWKAAKVFEEQTGRSLGGIAIRMTKRIPSEAGMGGGSADAAAVLRGLNRFCGEPFTLLQLADLGGRIGSDVPFCVVNGTWMCEGRGEKLRRLPDLPRCDLVICKPEFGVSTPALYRKIDETEITRRPSNPAMEQALQAADLREAARQVWNVFDPVVSAEHPEISEIKKILTDCGALAAQMTGSGSAVFGIMPDEASARYAQAVLEKRFPVVYRCQSV